MSDCVRPPCAVKGPHGETCGKWRGHESTPVFAKHSWAETAAADTHSAPDLAALRTSLRVEVERVCHGAEWGPRVTKHAAAFMRRPDGEAVAYELVSGEVEMYGKPSDPTTDIGAAMALVDQLQEEGWPGQTWGLFRAAVNEMARLHGWEEPVSPWWLERDCPPHLKAIVRTLAVLAARGAEWRPYLALLEEK